MDEETNDLMLIDGDLVLSEGEASVQEWLATNLAVPQDALRIYQGTDIGIPLRELIGAKGKLPKNTILAVLRGRIEETALLCPAVSRVQDVALEQNGRNATMAASFETVYSEGYGLEMEASYDL